MATTGAAPAAKTSGFAALRVHSFRLFIVATACSRLGDNMEQVIRSWLVWQLTESPFLLGLMIFFHWIPNTTLSILAGALADRVNNRNLIIFSECMYLISALGTGVLTVAGVVNVWHIAGLLLVHGVAAAIANPSRQILVHDLVGKEKLMSAVSLNSSLFQSMAVVGPAVAGAIIVATGPGIAYLVDSLAFVPAIVIISFIRVGAKRKAPARTSALRSTVEGLQYVRGNPLLVSLLALTTVPAVLIGDSVAAMMPIFATRVLNVGAEGMALLLSGYGVGAISAGLFISYMGGLRRKGRLALTAAFLYGVFLVAFTLSSSYLLSIAVLVAAGACSVASQTMINVSIQLSAADHLRGRVMGLHSLGSLGVRSFNGPLIGTFAAAVGTPIALGVLSSVVSLAVIVNSVLSPEIRKLE